MTPDTKTKAAMKRIMEQFTVAERLDILEAELEKVAGWEPEKEMSKRLYRNALHAAKYEVSMIRKMV